MRNQEQKPSKLVLFLGLTIVISFINIWMSVFYVQAVNTKFALYSAIASVFLFIVSYIAYEYLIRKNK